MAPTKFTIRCRLVAVSVTAAVVLVSCASANPVVDGSSGIPHSGSAGMSAAPCTTPQAPVASVAPDPLVYRPDPADPHFHVAGQAMAALVNGVHLPVGARIVCDSPSPDLTGAFSTGSEPGFVVERYLYFTVQQSPDEVLGYVRAHPPTHNTGDAASGTVSKQQFISFDGPADPMTYIFPQVTVAAIAMAGGAAVQVDAQAVVAPSRTAAELIPATIDSVDITLAGSRSNIRYTLTRKAAQPIGAAVNALWPAAPVLVAGGPCGTDRGYRDQLAFHLPGGRTITVDASLDCPNPSASVTADGKVQPALCGYGTRGPALSTLDDAIIAATGYKPTK